MKQYCQILADVYPNRIAEGITIELPDELTLQSIWLSGQLGREFVTTDGKSIRILQFGFWNRASGPDFQHAAIEIDGKIVSGPIELDIHARDWENHGHDTNPSFNDVILHIIFRDSSHVHFTRSENHTEIPKIIIPESNIKAALKKPLRDTMTSCVGRCYRPLEKMSARAIENLMLAAAQRRLEQKYKRIQSIVNAHGRDQALWIGLAESLGYSRNREQMTQLAQRIPIAMLKNQANLTTPILFGISNFLRPGIHENATADSRNWLEQIWSDWWKLRSDYGLSDLRRMRWVTSGVRPSNHPQRRIAALTKIAQNWQTFMQMIDQFDPLSKWMEDINDPFWNYHYTLTSKRCDKKLKLIGKDRVRDFLINQIIPLHHRENADSTWVNYARIPGSTPNESIKRVGTRLFGNREGKDNYLRKAWQQQALMQIYHDFCLEDTSECAKCPFPEQLRQFAE